MNKTKKALSLQIYGTVQGVGFRPYICRTAKKNKLNGFVLNTSYGAEITIEGSQKNIKNFIYSVKKNEIDTANISKIVKIKRKTSNYKNFVIKKSLKKSQIISDFPADIAICADCKKELASQNDRRYHYPFINCTQCGPRYSIVKNLPYDRKNTTMKNFTMCNDCRREYEKIESRRFHAQPNACPICGPDVKLYIKNKFLVSGTPAIKKTAEMLDLGKILAVKTIGGYNFICNAYDNEAVSKLRKIKTRYKKPFAVMVKNITVAKTLTAVNKYEEDELSDSSAPIVLLDKKHGINNIFNEDIAPNNKYLGIMLPYAPLHCILFDLLKTDVLVVTSANKNNDPIIYTENEIFKEFGETIDGILANNREINNPVDDSIVLFLKDRNNKILLRRSRGYVPTVINTHVKENILAVGADIKNSFCLTRKNTAYLSAYCGDMTYYDNLKFLNKSINKFIKFLDVSPKKIAFDLHPSYNTSEYAKEKFKNKSYKFYPIQHHYAHIASVIAEHNVEGNIIGFAYDGTGFGYDNKIWGSECLLFGEKSIKRLAHFEYFELLGGDLATKEIWRIALSLLYKYKHTDNVPSHIKKEKFYSSVLSLLKIPENSVQTCSVGRFLDGIASLIGLANSVEYEGQATIHLESVLKNKIYKTYPFDIEFCKNTTAIIKLNKIIDGILKDLQNGTELFAISGKIHETICQLIYAQAVKYSKIYKTNKVALSGGVFQNKYILSRTVETLEKSQFKVYFNSSVPINDGGISLGQAYLIND